MSGEFKEREKSEKDILWEKTADEVENITDGLGKKIEDGVKETVIAFNVNGIPTSQSCEGHLQEEGRGRPFPWVEVYAPEPEGWKQSEGEHREELERVWKEANLQNRRKVMDYLSEFYQSSDVLSDTGLSFHDIGIFGGFRVQSSGAEEEKSLSPEEEKTKLELYRKELTRFTEFLKQKFFAE